MDVRLSQPCDSTATCQAQHSTRITAIHNSLAGRTSRNYRARVLRKQNVLNTAFAKQRPSWQGFTRSRLTGVIGNMGTASVFRGLTSPKSEQPALGFLKVRFPGMVLCGLDRRRNADVIRSTGSNRVIYFAAHCLWVKDGILSHALEARMAFA